MKTKKPKEHYSVKVEPAGRLLESIAKIDPGERYKSLGAAKRAQSRALSNLAKHAPGSYDGVKICAHKPKPADGK